MSTTSFVHSRRGQSFLGKNYAGQVPRAFTGRVFKGPPLSSFPPVPATKFEGYHTAPPVEQRQSQNWYPSRPREHPPPSEVPKAVLTLSDNSTAASRNHDSISRPITPSYSIYAANDMYIYERSLSSVFSNTDYDGASTTTFSPSSAFSPALSTDSTMTLTSPMAGETLLDSRSSTPIPARNAFPVLSHAQTALRDVFRSQTSSSARRDNSLSPHAPSSMSSIIFGQSDDPRLRAATPAVQGRSTTPIRLTSVSTGSETRSTNQAADLHPAPAPATYSSQSYASSIVSESDDGEVHRLARANADYNAASSAYYSSPQSSDPASRTTTDAPAAPRQIYSNLPLRSSPEQQYRAPTTYSRAPGDSNQGDTSSYPPTDRSESRGRSQPLYHNGELQSNERRSVQSEEFLPPLPHLDQEPITASRPPPIRRQSEYSQIPEILNEGHLSRYVPASRTMVPDVPARASGSSSDSQTTPREADRRQDRALPVPPSSLSRQPSLPRERRVSLSQPLAPYPLSQGMPIFSASSDGRLTAPPPLSQRPNSQRENSVSFSQSQPPCPISQGGLSMPTAPRNVNGVSVALDQAGEREGEALKRSPQGQRPMPSNSSAARDPALSRDQPPLLLPGISISMLSVDRNPAALSSSPEQISDNDVPRESSIAETSRHRHDPRYQFSTAADLLNPPANRSSPTPNLKSSPEQIHDTIRRKMSISNTAPVHHDPPTIKYLDPRVSPTVAPLPSHTRSQKAFPPSDSISPRNQPISSPPRSHQPAPAERGRSVDAPSSAVDNDLPSPTTVRRPSVPFTGQAADSRGATSQPPRSETRIADTVNYENRTTFVGPQPRESTSSRSQPAFRPSNNLRPPEGAPIAFANSSSEKPGTRMNSKADTQDTTRSHTPFTEPGKPVSEPHRRHSDGDRSTNNDFPSRTAPPYASSDPTNNTTGQNMGPPRTSPTASMPGEPQRRNSDGGQVANTSGRNSVLCRSVRWNENLVCPSPIWPSQRRKGWFNRRGDQLWTNEGAYKPAPSSEDFPPDLADYPEYGQGWMNEEGVRIDMGHRLIPKTPLRSALKQSRIQV